MVIDTDKHLELLDEALKEDEQNGGENQQSLVCLSTFAPSVVLYHQYVYGQLSLLNQNSQDLRKQIQHLNEIVQHQGQRCDQYVTIIANCQRDTAKVLNQELERHVLKPAVEAIVTLADELFHLDELVKHLCQGAVASDELEKLEQDVQISNQIARDKMTCLDIERITPSKGDSFEPQTHIISAHAETSDKALHGKIKQTITPGIVYRSKVLRQARVSVFRYVQINESIEEKGAKNE